MFAEMVDRVRQWPHFNIWYFCTEKFTLASKQSYYRTGVDEYYESFPKQNFVLRYVSEQNVKDDSSSKTAGAFRELSNGASSENRAYFIVFVSIFSLLILFPTLRWPFPNPATIAPRRTGSRETNVLVTNGKLILM
jgi:hypothetical protein